MRVTHNSSLTDKPVALEYPFELLVFEGGGSLWGGKPENPEKNPQSRDENQQQTQFTYDAGSGNRTRDTLVVGERSNNCATTAPPLLAKTVYFAKITFCPGKGRGGRGPPLFSWILKMFLER